MESHHQNCMYVCKQGMWAHKIWKLFQNFMIHNLYIVNDILWPWNFQQLLNIKLAIIRYISYIIIILIMRYDLLCDRMQFVPTCPVSAGPVTYTLYSISMQSENYIHCKNKGVSGVQCITGHHKVLYASTHQNLWHNYINS